MTKKELLKLLETVPDNFYISVCAVTCEGIDCDAEITKVEVNSDLNTVYLHLDEDELYNL